MLHTLSAVCAEYIGTKTAVQIRSHAQKFFNKLEKKKEAGELPAKGTASRQHSAAVWQDVVCWLQCAVLRVVVPLGETKMSSNSLLTWRSPGSPTCCVSH